MQFMNQSNINANVNAKRGKIIFSLLVALAAFMPLALVQAQSVDEKPDAMIKRVADEVLRIVKTDKALQAGDASRAVVLLDTKVLPHFNFTRFTATAVGPAWRQASPEQKTKLQDEFRQLLIKTYLGGMTQIKNESLVVKPLRAAADDTEVLVRTELRGRGEPLSIDYRAEKTDKGWKVYDLNVLGIWMAESYKGQFVPIVNTKGVDGLIASLVERNRAAPAKK
jgi:phospholipid transport system substrate-binding protein